MTTQRTLLLFNLGLAFLFLVFGWLSTYTIQTLLPNVGRSVETPTLSAVSRNELVQEQDIDRLRTRALLYFDVSVGLKRVNTGQEQNLLEGGRYVCYILAALFGVGGLLVLASAPAKPKSSPSGRAA